MPVEYQLSLDEDRGFLLVKIIGDLDLASIRKQDPYTEEILKGTAVRRILVDNRLAKVRLTSLDIFALARMREGSFLGSCKHALVYAPGSSGPEMFESITQGLDMPLRIFTDYDEALAWLLKDSDDSSG